MGVFVTFCITSIYAITLRVAVIFSFYLVLFGSGKSGCFTPNVAQIWHKLVWQIIDFFYLSPFHIF